MVAERYLRKPLKKEEFLIRRNLDEIYKKLLRRSRREHGSHLAYLEILSCLIIIAALFYSNDFLLHIISLSADRAQVFGDFASYWAAFQTGASGHNPYDLALINNLLGKYGWIGMNLFHPPYVVVLLSPILIFPLGTALGMWFGLSILKASGGGLLLKLLEAGYFLTA